MASDGKRVAAAVAALVFVLCAFGISQLGFQKVQDFRMLERIPLTSISAAVPGEVQLKGRANALQTIKTPYTGTEVIYYRYLIEQEQRDSEGRRSWRTIRDEARGATFQLEDKTGDVRVKFHPSVQVNVPQRHRSQAGKLRHTEWWLTTGDTISLFAWMEDTAEKTVNFRHKGNYLPIISAAGSSAERNSLGNVALAFIWGGVTSMIIACLALMIVLKAHRTLLFLTTTSVACFVLLANLGWQSVKTDVDVGYAQVKSYLDRATDEHSDTANQTINESANINESATTDERIATQSLMIQRFERQTAHFPESLVFAMGDYETFPNITLTESQQQIAIEKARAFAVTQASQSYFLMSIGLLLAAALAWVALRIIRIKRIQENIPTSKTAGVAYGLAEVVGTLKNEQDRELLIGPVSGIPCCWYRELVQERRGSGKHSKWVTLKNEVRKQPFMVADDEGHIRVFPGQAEVITRHKRTRREGSYRYTEWRLSPGDDMYVIGKARLDKTKGDSLVFGHEQDTPYIIANIPEAEVMLRKALSGMMLLSFGMSLLFLTCIWIGGASGSFSSIDFLLAAGLAPMFLLLVMIMLMYNDLVFLRERCERNWANIQVSLKKRADLLPRLESVVKEYLDHEQHLQSRLALLRERSRNIETSSDMDQYMAAEHVSLAELKARIEQYPDLKGTKLIQDFHKRLVKLENEVALIRQGFNDSVTQYRTRSQTFPDNLLAKIFRFTPRTLLSYSEKAHPIPQIKLDP